MLYKIFSFIFIFNLLVSPASAQSNAMALSVSPPLIKNNVAPGQIWQSTVKVVNNNPEEISVYIQALDFQGNGEDGTVTFIQPSGTDEENEYLLSRWIDLPEESLAIPAGKSHEVPFIVNVPETAAPGGHYAAIMVGTQPPADKVSGTSIKVSSLIATLVMLSVSGEAVENGQIREFSTDKSFYGSGDVNFKVRFENLGNVHVQPQGEIRIFNMQNKNINSIKINHSTEFGNVLPKSVRSWDFRWEETIGLSEMGRYRAELILSYGSRARETVTQTRYFWILLYKPLAIIIASIILFFLAVYLLIRRSVRKAIRQTEKLTGVVHPEQKANPRVTVLPKENGNEDQVVVNLKSQNIPVAAKRKAERGLGWRVFKVLAYLAIFAVAGLLAIFAAREYWPEPESRLDPVIEENSVIQKTEPDMENAIGDDLPAETASSAPEAIPASSKASTSPATSAKDIKSETAVVVLNGSGTLGAAGRAKELLVQAGFTVSSTGNADNYDYRNTVIKYPAADEASAILIKKLFPDPVELQSVEDAEVITVITGKNF